MPDRVEFRLTLPTAVSTPSQLDPDAPFRLLIIADFSNRAAGDAWASGLDWTDCRPLPVDTDQFDSVMSRLAPRLCLSFDGDMGTETTTIHFKELDDFHPDALCRQLQCLQTLCHSLTHPPTSADLAKAARLKPSPRVDAANSSSSAEEDNNILLERLLGRTSNQSKAGSGSSAGAIDGLLKAIVQPHIVQTDQQQAAWRAATEALLGDRLRAILHHPDF